MRPELPDLALYVERVRDIWSSRMLSNFGKYAGEFERKVQGYLGNSCARVLASGDVGLIVALHALALPEGSEVVLPSFTFNSTVNAVLWNRLVPVFCDIDPGTFCADPEDVERAAGPRAAAVLATHVFGTPCDAERLRDLCHRRALALGFDAAHAFGSTYRGRRVGHLGDFEVFSFSGTKLVTSAEGGAVSCRTASMAERVEYARAYGFQGDYNSIHVGLNGKISELNAALGSLTVDLVDSAVSRRSVLAGRYHENLTDLPMISFQEIPGDCTTTYKDFAIVCAQGRDALAAALRAAGIQTKTYFLPLHGMPAYRRYHRRPLPRTEELARHVLCLPIFNEMSLAEVDMVCDVIRIFFRPQRRRARSARRGA